MKDSPSLSVKRGEGRGGEGVGGGGAGGGVDLLVQKPVSSHLICNYIVFPFSLLNLYDVMNITHA